MELDSGSVHARKNFYEAQFDLTSRYANHFFSTVDSTHLHKGVPSTVCSVCNTLAKVAPGDISAGARAVRSSRAPRRSRSMSTSSRSSSRSVSRPTDPCAPRDDETMKTVPIDEIASTHEWTSRLRRDGDAIVRYLIDNKCDIQKFTIQDMLGIMRRLNIVRTGRQEIFELLAHIKGSLSTSSAAVRATHPLVLIHSRADARIGEQLRELERVYSPSHYQALIATTRFQSANFTDMSSSQDLLFRYRDGDSTCFVHPIMVALFGVKLPAIENAFVYGDSYSLLRQLYEMRKVRPENYMLLVNRLTEETPILFTGVNDSVSTEIQRANLHSMIRKLILNIRLGIFYCNECEAVDPLLMKIIHTGSSQMMPDEEQILASLLSVVGVRPALVSVAAPSPDAHATYSGVKLRAVPYIVINPSLMVSTMDNPITINSHSVHSLTFDGASGRVIFAPPASLHGTLGYGGLDMMPLMRGSVHSVGRQMMTPPLIVNGTLFYYVDRRQQRAAVGGECLTNFRSIINDVPMDVALEITINGIAYRLKSAVCYKVSDQVMGGCDITDAFLKGYYTIVFTELGPWLYDPMAVFSKASREARLMRSLKNYYHQENADADEASFFDWVKQESSQPIYIAKQQQLMNHYATFDDDMIPMEEAMAMVSRHCCILVYAQDYDPYVSSKSIADIIC